jgi:cell wall-associated NlpC family hydrolase
VRSPGVARGALVVRGVGVAAAVLGLQALASMPLSRPVDLATDQREAAALAARLSVLDGQIQAAAERYDAAEVQLAQVADQLAVVRERVAHDERRVRVLRQQLQAAALRQFAASGQSSGLVALLQGSVGDAAIVQTDVAVAASSETQLEANVRAAELGLLEQRAELETLMATARADAASAAAARSAAAQEQAAVESELVSLKGQMAALVAQAQAAQQQAAERAAQAALAAEATTPPPAPPAGLAQAPPPSGALAQAAQIAEAIAQRGDTGYLYGAAGQWSQGIQYFDCSGLVMYVFAQVGISLPHDAAAQYADSMPIGYGQLAPGDLVFYDTLGSSSIDHVAIYVGGGQVVEATEPGRPVAVDPITWSGAPVGFAQP